jgi:hypothetical protein
MRKHDKYIRDLLKIGKPRLCIACMKRRPAAGPFAVICVPCREEVAERFEWRNHLAFLKEEAAEKRAAWGRGEQSEFDEGGG